MKQLAAAATAVALATPLALALAQWSSDPAENLAVVAAAGGQELPKVASAPDNSTWISWFDNRGSGYQVRIQRLDAAGNKTFGADGLLVSAHPQSTSLVEYDLVADGAGNAVLVFTDTRSDPNRDVYAYLITPTGEFLWGPDGVTLSANNVFEAEPRAVVASNGEYVFLWSRLGDPGRGLHMQRLTADGTKLLGPDGIVVAGNGVEGPAFSEMVAAENGSVIAVWVRDTRTFASPRHLHAQKLDADGEPVWEVNPVVISDAPVPIAHRPRIASDGGSGAFFAWHDSRLSNQSNVWVQRVSAAGTPLFPAGGVRVSTNNVDRQHYDPALAVTPGTNTAFVFWNERNGGQSQWGVSGQRIGPTGLRQWGDTGLSFVPVNTTNKGFIRAVPVGGDAVVAFFDQPQTPLPGNRVLAMRIDAAGAQVWPGAPILASSLVSTKGRLPVAFDPATGMAKLVWEDQRSGTTDVYAQNVNADGTLGNQGGSCPADWNDDGQVNSGDITAFLSSWIASLQNGTLDADFNGDGAVNSADITAFLSAWLDAVGQGGC